MVISLFASSAFAQVGSVTGTVADAATGELLPGANIYVLELERGAATNIDGEYEIRNIPSGTYTIRVSYVGYAELTQTIEVGAGGTVVNFGLENDFLGLDEVIVTGYGTMERSSFTGTASTVSGGSLESVPVASVDQALQGKATGVFITNSTGTPGATQDIRIRGISSVNASTAPLFVIDGVPVISGDNAQSTATSSFGVLSTLSNSDIESITVLKDAASTAPYGARGSNGVIVITTKKGTSSNKTTYSLTVQRGVNERAVEGEGAMNAQEWADFWYEAAGNYLEAYYGGLLADPDNAEPSEVDALFGDLGWDGETDTDWGDVVQDDNAVQQEYTLSARGGNDQTTFYVSGSIFQQEGQIKGTEVNRYRGNFDFSHQLDERVKLSNTFSGSFVEQDGILEGAGYFGSPILSEYFMPPIETPYTEDGEINTNLGTSIFNPVYVQANDIDRKRNYRIINNTTLDINIAKNLDFSTRFAADYLETEEKYYDNILYGDSEDTQGSVDDISNRNFNYVWQNILTYLWLPNKDNTVTFRGISESQRNYFYYLEGYGEGIAAPGLINLNTTASPQFVGSSTTDWAVQSFTGLVNYGFQDKLFVDGSLRYEGNSRFAEDNRWGTFWSLGLGYVLTEEDFLKDVSVIDFLKIRGSFGKTGNSGVGLNNYQALIGFGSYNDIPNIQPNQLANPGLTWEVAYSADLGIDFEMFQRMSGSVTVFNKNTEDLLFDMPLSFTTGHETQSVNLGKLYNRGIEIEANVDVIQGRDLNWNIGGNFSALKNEVTELPTDLNGEDVELTTATRYTAVVGYEVNAWYMREWAGVDPENGDPLWYMDELDGDGNPTGNRVTTNNYNEADTYYQGASALPTKFGGVSTRVDYKGFYASADLYYSFGNKVYDSWAGYMRSDGRVAGSFGQYARQTDYWTPENTDAENPRPFYGGNNNAYQTSSRFLYDGDYLRLKTVNIGYTIPAKYIRDLGLQSATLYFLGQNLWTYAFDDDLNFDPEVRADGFIDLNATAMKSMTFGVKVNF